jgi:predicted porin
MRTATTRASIASGLLALAGGAAAQSSLTLFGVVDTTIAHGSGSIASRTQLASSGNQTSRIGLRGVEDLGGGLSAGFWLEGALTTDDGQGSASNSNNQPSGTGPAVAGRQGLAFGRRSTISLIAPWGEIRAGRDYVAHYRNRLEVDPFQNVGVGTIQPQVGSLGGTTSTRVSNFVGYYLPPDVGGIFGFAQYYLGENASDSAGKDDGSGASVRLGYAAGPWNVSVATGRTRFARTATTGDIQSSNLGLQYRVGPANLLFGYFVDKVDSATPVTGRGASLGTTIAVGAGEIKAALSNYRSDAGTRPETKKLSLGYVHNLSKRTAVYTTYARLRNSGGATTALNGSTTGPDRSSSGWDLGVRHNF